MLHTATVYVAWPRKSIALFNVVTLCFLKSASFFPRPTTLNSPAWATKQRIKAVKQIFPDIVWFLLRWIRINCNLHLDTLKEIFARAKHRSPLFSITKFYISQRQFFDLSFSLRKFQTAWFLISWYEMVLVRRTAVFRISIKSKLNLVNVKAKLWLATGIQFSKRTSQVT